MVKILSILIATLAAVSPLAQAGACTPGLIYCGHTLETYGYPGAQNLDTITLYSCQSDGSVKKLKKCSVGMFCIDGGGGNDDFCDFAL
ncbi:hypothetical protein E4U60_005604 [Claviceps pazoutovae]|uniref:Uncharacterized protein n=1 Tax=Claviceps pazoutovae TaxID=1649127 RepID=A0A9P7MJD8_9HYPO|nr:hypothetical protein E4U60_005604 [Claviceps pazoutovae]